MISGLIVAAILTGITWNLPASKIRQEVMTVVAPIGFATGLGQTWDVFAPNPPRQNDYLSAVVTFAGGREVTWTPPRGDPLFATYANERWHKLREFLQRTPSLRPTFAHWVVRQLSGPGDRAVRVRILDRTVLLAPPGSAVVPRATVRVLYDETVGGS